MKLRPSQSSDLPAIMSIVKDAQELLASQGIDQWQDGYPDVHQIELDIANSDSYVLENKEGNIIATTVLCTTGEPTYHHIEGEWITPMNTSFGVIHRLAVKKEFRNTGVAQYIFDRCEDQLLQQGIRTMRIDTHQDNTGMQGLLKKRGYVYCGIIYLESGAKRLAYEKLLIK